MASEGAAPASQMSVPDTSPEEEFNLFGPSAACGPSGTSAENSLTQSSLTAAQTSPAGTEAAIAGAGADFQSIILAIEPRGMLRQQSLTM